MLLLTAGAFTSIGRSASLLHVHRLAFLYTHVKYHAVRVLTNKALLHAEVAMRVVSPPGKMGFGAACWK
jgi:hypothetical protein